MTDLYAKGVAESTTYAVDRAYLRVANFAHMTRMTSEAKTSGANSWMASHVRRRRGYRPPKGKRLRLELRHQRKALAGRYYQPRGHGSLPVQ